MHVLNGSGCWRLAAVVAGSLLAAGCGEVVCEGECPLPNVGVLVDAGSVEKSILLSADRLGGQLHLCVLPPSESNDLTVILDGYNGILIVDFAGGKPGDTLFVSKLPSDGSSTPCINTRTVMIDVDLDGRLDGTLVTQSTGFFGCPGPEFLDRSGRRLFGLETCDLEFSIGSSSSESVLPGDLDGDGVLEFFVAHCDEVIIFNADGTERGRVVDDREGQVQYKVARLDEGPSHVIASWPGSAFDEELPEETRIWSPEGVRLDNIDLSRLTLLPTGACYLCSRGINCAKYCPGAAEPSCGEYVHESEACTQFRAEVSVSRVFRSVFLSFSVLDARTIVRIYDKSGTLVYHEVRDGGGGDFAVVPPGAESNDLLLVVNKDKLVGYRYLTNVEGCEVDVDAATTATGAQQTAAIP